MTDAEEPIAVLGIDSLQDQKYRAWASISFAVLLFAIGVPLWWQTTAVPRAGLPFDRIYALDDIDLHVHARVFLGCLDDKRCEEFAVEMLRRLTDAGNSDIYRVSVSHFGTGNTSIARAKVIADLDKASKGFDLNYGDVLVLEAPNSVLGEHDVYVTSERSVYFSDKADGGTLAQVLRRWILRDNALNLTRNALTTPTEYSLDVENRRRFPVSPNYDVLLTIVNPEPENIIIDRQLPRQLAQNYIESFLDDISFIANFSVKSQWLYLLPLGVNTKMVPDTSKLGRHFALPEELLPQMITPLEKKLASQVSLYPTINLVMYIVPCSSGPLHIYLRNGHRPTKKHNYEAFHSPRWGGIVLTNPPDESCEQTKESYVFEPKDEIGVFLAQLRLLLGIVDKNAIKGATIAPLSAKKKVRDWEIDDLLRIRSIEQLTSAKLTLQSLARLLKEISNIVITDTVGNRIESALALTELSAQLLHEGKLRDGYLASKDAFVMSEAAFTDPSLLALLYFPDDQKCAVYIPLFLPIIIPVLFSFKNIKNYLFCSD